MGAYNVAVKSTWRLFLAISIFNCLIWILPGAGRQQSTGDDAKRSTLGDGAVVRGDLRQKRIPLIFTRGEYGEGTGPILDTLGGLKIKAGSFVTGGFLSDAGRRQLLERALEEGHYVRPHSDQHPLYCPWNDREKSLISETEFKKDLEKNSSDLKQLRALASEPIYFIPPHEWFNGDQVKWAKEMGLLMFNCSPESGSNRDHTPKAIRSWCLRRGFLKILWRARKKIRMD
jgi:peptidoglycan/xylan/chitin deacetylase (PgdA/CDA1 family)